MKSVTTFDDLIHIFTELKNAGTLIKQADTQFNVSSIETGTTSFIRLELTTFKPAGKVEERGVSVGNLDAIAKVTLTDVKTEAAAAQLEEALNVAKTSSAFTSPINKPNIILRLADKLNLRDAMVQHRDGTWYINPADVTLVSDKLPLSFLMKTTIDQSELVPVGLMYLVSEERLGHIEHVAELCKQRREQKNQSDYSFIQRHDQPTRNWADERWVDALSKHIPPGFVEPTTYSAEEKAAMDKAKTDRIASLD